jgi:hypothetical protein
MNAPISAGLSNVEIAQLAQRLGEINNKDALSLEGVDGLFCALVGSPDIVPPNEYLPVILGGALSESGTFAELEDADATLSRTKTSTTITPRRMFGRISSWEGSFWDNTDITETRS